jgi:hypothetical protein
MTASVQMTVSVPPAISASGSIAGLRGAPSPSVLCAATPDTGEESSLDTSSQAARAEYDAPADDSNLEHSTLEHSTLDQSTFGAIFHQYFRSPGGNGRPGTSDRSGPQKGNASDPVLLLAPVPSNEQMRAVIPLVLAIPWSKNEIAPSNDSGASSPEADLSSPIVAETPDSPGRSLFSSKSSAPGIPAPAAPSGEIAFAARLSPADAPAPAEDTTEAAASSVRAQSGDLKQALWSDTAMSVTAGKATSDARGEQSGKASATPLPSPLLHPSPSAGDPTSVPAHLMKSEVRSGSGSSAARVEAAAEGAVARPGSSRDIMVRIPDATDRGTNVRFVERGSEVHIAVHTGDSELAQTLRSGLSDLTARLQHTGIQAEVWRPGSESSQSDSRNQSQDPRDSGDRRNEPGAQRDGQDPPSDEKPRWVQELDASFREASGTDAAGKDASGREPAAHSGS